MTDHQFLVELRIRAYIDQIAGYPLGHPGRENFQPIVPTHETRGGGLDIAATSGPLLVNRNLTLDLPCYHNFSQEDRKLLLTADAACDHMWTYLGNGDEWRYCQKCRMPYTDWLARSEILNDEKEKHGR